MRPVLTLLVLSLFFATGQAWSQTAEAFLEKARPFTIASLEPVKPDPSNRFVKDPAAIALGKSLFFDQGLSLSGTVSCATCHVTEGSFRPNESIAAARDRQFRTVMPIQGAAYQDFLFWDGRADSLWMQALGPLENPSEHGLSRSAVASYVAKTYGDDLKKNLGQTDLPEIQSDATPLGTAAQRAAWSGLSEKQRGDIDQVFVAVGKSIAAYEAQVPIEPNLWDKLVSSVADNSDNYAKIPLDVLNGFSLFTGKAGCSACHTGPLFADLDFHNTGLPTPPNSSLDIGRQAVSLDLFNSPFNCLGVFSDAAPKDCGKLRFFEFSLERLFGTFRTPTLRGVSGRQRLGHSGNVESLTEMVRHYNLAPDGPHGLVFGRVSFSELKPLHLSEEEVDAIVAFLKAL